MGQAEKTYISLATGRRKSASARVFLHDRNEDIVVNGKPLEQAFGRLRLQMVVRQVLEQVREEGFNFGVVTTVKGGGTSAQAEAIRHGIARAVVQHKDDLRDLMRENRWLTRDSRKVERKKYGLRKARKAPQFSKR